MIPDTQPIVDRLREMHRRVRALVKRAHGTPGLHDALRATAADTIYGIDTEVEPIIDEFCREWSKATPLVLIAEGIEDEHGNEGERVYPIGSREADAKIRLIIDPIDGTRGLMYDKRSAWSLAGVAPNNGPGTRLRDIEVAVMTELPTSKMGFADVLWAIKNGGAHGVRENLSSNESAPLTLAPSRAASIDHGFASVSNFFPATKVLAAELMEHIVAKLLKPQDITRASVFDDQYISTAGQWYELMVGHDRFNADLRPVFYRIQNHPLGMCCHPYDCAAMLIAEQAGVILTDERGKPLDGPLDCTTSISWVGYANQELRRQIEPILLSKLKSH